MFDVVTWVPVIAALIGLAVLLGRVVATQAVSNRVLQTVVEDVQKLTTRIETITQLDKTQALLSQHVAALTSMVAELRHDVSRQREEVSSLSHRVQAIDPDHENNSGVHRRPT